MFAMLRAALERRTIREEMRHDRDHQRLYDTLSALAASPDAPAGNGVVERKYDATW